MPNPLFYVGAIIDLVDAPLSLSRSWKDNSRKILARDDENKIEMKKKVLKSAITRALLMPNDTMLNGRAIGIYNEAMKSLVKDDPLEALKQPLSVPFGANHAETIMNLDHHIKSNSDISQFRFQKRDDYQNKIAALRRIRAYILSPHLDKIFEFNTKQGLCIAEEIIDQGTNRVDDTQYRASMKVIENEATYLETVDRGGSDAFKSARMLRHIETALLYKDIPEEKTDQVLGLFRKHLSVAADKNKGGNALYTSTHLKELSERISPETSEKVRTGFLDMTHEFFGTVIPELSKASICGEFCMDSKNKEFALAVEGALKERARRNIDNNGSYWKPPSQTHTP